MEVGSGTGLALGSSRIVKEQEKSFPSKSSGTSTENVKSTDSPGAIEDYHPLGVGQVQDSKLRLENCLTISQH